MLQLRWQDKNVRFECVYSQILEVTMAERLNLFFHVAVYST